jgi:hypothetical protein
MEMTVSCSATILSQSVFVRSMRLILFHVSSAGILFCAHACSPATKDEPTSDNFALLRQRAKMVRGGANKIADFTSLVKKKVDETLLRRRLQQVSGLQVQQSIPNPYMYRLMCATLYTLVHPTRCGTNLRRRRCSS